MEQTLFKQQVSSLSRRYLFLKGLTFGVLFSFFFFLFYLALQVIAFFSGVIIPESKIAAAGIPAAAAALALTKITTSSLLDCLIAADQRLGLKDLLSTAFEVSAQKKYTRFSGDLFAAASAQICRQGVRRILPFAVNRIAVFIPVLLIISVVFSYVTAPKPEKKDLSPPDSAVVQLHKKIEQLEEQLADDGRESENRDLIREVKRTAGQVLELEQEKSKEVIRSFGGLLETIENRNREDLKRLKDQMTPEGRGQGMNIPMPAPGPEKKQIKQQLAVDLEDLKKRVDQAFDGEPPEHLQKDIRDIESNVEFQKYLQDLLKKYGAFEPEEAEEEPDGGRMAEQGSEPIDTDDDNGTQNGGKGDRNSRKEGAMAGNQTPEERKKEASNLLPAKGNIEKDKTGDFNKGSFAYTVKALSDIGVSKKEHEKIKKQYQQQNEAILEKENIPAEYREDIRDYFLSIGLGKE